MCAEQVRGRVPVIAGAGSNDTATAIRHMAPREGSRCRRGADGRALLQSPEPRRDVRSISRRWPTPATCRSSSITSPGALSPTSAPKRCASSPKSPPSSRSRMRAATSPAFRSIAPHCVAALPSCPAMTKPRCRFQRDGRRRVHLGHRQRRAQACARSSLRHGPRATGRVRWCCMTACSTCIRRCSPTPRRGRSNMRCRASTTGFRPKCAYLSSPRATQARAAVDAALAAAGSI